MKPMTMVAVLSLLAAPALAQERTAGQAYDAQVNWSALKASIDQLSTQNKAIAASLTTLQKTVSDLATTVSTLSGKVTVLDGKVSAIAACGAQQKVWNGSACVSAGSDKVQVGNLADASSFAPRSFRVNFAKPFTAVPNVYLALNRYNYHDNCREDQFITSMTASSVTTTGFTLTLGGSIICGGQERVEGVTWIAVQP